MQIKGKQFNSETWCSLPKLRLIYHDSTVNTRDIDISNPFAINGCLSVLPSTHGWLPGPFPGCRMPRPSPRTGTGTLRPHPSKTVSLFPLWNARIPSSRQLSAPILRICRKYREHQYHNVRG